MRLLPLLVLCLCLNLCPLVQLRAATLQLASGEFEPYVGAKLPGYGISSQLVREALALGGHHSQVEFMPWRRAEQLLKHGRYAGSYPWAMNAERQQSFLYSQPIYEDQIRFFARTDAKLDDQQHWHGKTACIPAGWDLQQVQAWLDKYQLKLERPPELENCFRMQQARRVDLIPVNRFVGEFLARRLFGATAVIKPVGEVVARDRNYFIVAKEYPGASLIIADINRGLSALHKSGRYQQLFNQALGL